ncbi:copper oxidase [Myxococcus stipitatus]|uniref:multicopper oxidase family protein n=1 Tax=Myxococcus stipitatus TaxID=83455 RepID=UPI0030CB3DCF
MDRREFMQFGALAGGTLLAGQALAQTPSNLAPAVRARAEKPRIVAPGGQVAVVTPNGSTLPWKNVGGVKVGHLVAMPVRHTFAPGLEVEAWGYNGSTPGPTIEAVEGDRIRIYVTNRLPEPTTVHWHGLILPNGMDGVSGLNQRPIAPGETFAYEFTLNRAGTYMYHPHYDEMTQMALGMMGMLIVHPKRSRGPRVDRDFALMTHEWKVLPGMRRPDPNAMSDFNVLTFNSKAFPATAPLVIGRGERVRIRLGNLSAMDHHPIHLHGLYFEVTGTDGGFVPESARYPETSVLVPVGSTRVIEFVADEPGDWAMHCHMTHHVMNQMGHAAPVTVGANARNIDKQVQALVPQYMTMGQDGMGGMEEMGMPVPPNSIPMKGGKGPFGSIDMGGMFTVLKVRENPEAEDGSGWYVHPKGTVADKADPAKLAADGIDPDVRFG